MCSLVGWQMSVAERLGVARQELGWTRREVGERAGVDLNMIYEYESGRRNPSTLALRGLAALYGRPVEWFYGEGDDDAGEDDIDIEDPDLNVFFRGEWGEFNEREREFIRDALRDAAAYLKKRRDMMGGTDARS